MVGKRYKSGTKICVFEKSCWQHRAIRRCVVLWLRWCWLKTRQRRRTKPTARRPCWPCTGSPTCDYGGRDGRAALRARKLNAGISPAVKERQDVQCAWFRLAGYVRRRADATYNHRGGATGHSQLLRARLAQNAREFCLNVDSRDKTFVLQNCLGLACFKNWCSWKLQ